MDEQVLDLYEPKSRFWHAACSSDGKVFVWGGKTSDFYLNGASGRIKLASVVEQFNSCTEVWCQHDTVGIPHPGLSAAACTSFRNYLYLYGGWDGRSYCGALSRLDLKTLTWSLLFPKAFAGGPMRKFDCGIFAFHDGDKVAVIGGYGIPTGHTQSGATFIRDARYTDGRGWSNEFHVFNISQDVWSSPTIRGTRPPPCVAFTLTSIDNHRAVHFGGYQPGRGRVNDLYIINFDAMEITQVEQHEGNPWPVEREYHAACCLGYGGGHPHLIVIGGTGKDGLPLTDMWLFDLSLRNWKEVTLPDGMLPRWGHSVAVVTLCQRVEEIILYGGSTDVYSVLAIKYSRIADTTIITYGQLGSEWVLVGVTINSQRGNNERIMEKIYLIRGIDMKGSLFDREKRVTTYALYRVERGGVQLRAEISKKNRDFQAILRLKQPDANTTMIKWLNTEQKTDIIPTWKNLFLILQLINLDHLAKQVEAFLRGTTVKQLAGDTSSMEQVQGDHRKRTREQISGDSLSSPESFAEYVGPSSSKKQHTSSEIQLPLETHEDTQMSDEVSTDAAIKSKPRSIKKKSKRKACNKPTLKYLMKELDTKLASEWEDLGIELEVKDGLLKKIKADYPQNCTKCLRETLRLWLKITNPPPSWDTIINAVYELNHEDFATRLRAKYCTTPTSSGSQETQ